MSSKNLQLGQLLQWLDLVEGVIYVGVLVEFTSYFEEALTGYNCILLCRGQRIPVPSWQCEVIQ